MRYIPIVPIFLVLMLGFTFGCQQYEDALPQNEALNELEMEIPEAFLVDTGEKNTQTEWKTIDSEFDGELRITTDESGFISSVRVRGNIVNHIKKNHLVSKFRDMGIKSLAEVPNLLNNEIPLSNPGGGGEGEGEEQPGEEEKEEESLKDPYEYARCFISCVGLNINPLNMAVCAALCAI